MGLRLEEGLDLERLARIGGVRPSEAAVAELCRQGLIAAVDGGSRIKATASGRMVLNELVLRLSAGFEHPIPV